MREQNSIYLLLCRLVYIRNIGNPVIAQMVNKIIMNRHINFLQTTK